jgi:hypothetical protein
MKRVTMLLSLAFLAGCVEPAPETEPGSQEPLLTAADSPAAVAQGGRIATALAQGLVQRLQAELKSSGAAGAVDFCSRTALALTDSLVATEAAGTAVKRTTTRIRNPKNAPDSLELAALAWFDSARAATGGLPPSFVQAAGTGEVRFYRPLVVQSFCTQCHGAPEQIDPDVRNLLSERYPADQAIGYREGDLRGVIRVSLPR